MKKYIAFIVAFVLLVVAIIVPQASANGVKAGKGNGSNDKLESLRDIQKFELYDDTATLYLSGEKQMDISTSAKGSQSSTKATIVYNASYYMGKKSQYMVVDASIYTYYAMESDDYDIDYSGAEAMNISFELFTDSNDELIRINRLDSLPTTYDQTAIALYLGKWVEEDADYLGVAELAWDTADSVLEDLFLLELIYDTDKNDWDESGKKLSLDEDLVEEVVGEYFTTYNEDDELTGEVKISFADKDAPKITFTGKAEYEDEDDSGKIDINAGANYIRAEVVLTNVGNTKIQEDIDKDDIITEKKMKKALKSAGLWDKYVDVDEEDE